MLCSQHVAQVPAGLEVPLEEEQARELSLPQLAEIALEIQLLHKVPNLPAEVFLPPAHLEGRPADHMKRVIGDELIVLGQLMAALVLVGEVLSEVGYHIFVVLEMSLVDSVQHDVDALGWDFGEHLGKGPQHLLLFLLDVKGTFFFVVFEGGCLLYRQHDHERD